MHPGRLIFRGAILTLAAVTAVCLFGGGGSISDRVSHFTFYWACAGFLLGLLALLRRRWLSALVCGLLATAHAVPVLCLWLPDAQSLGSSEGGQRLSIVSANLYAGNRRKPEALARLMELNPDVLLVMEIGREWRTVLKPLVERYPHRVGTDGTIWLLSRCPLRQTWSGETARESGVSASPIIEATVLTPHSSLRIVGIHATRPTGAAGIAQQTRQASGYVKALGRDGDAPHRLLIGDFNTSPFSEVFRHIVQTTGLRDAAQGRGYQPTWGPRLLREPLLPWIGIPIDHALVSKSVTVEAWSIGAMPGADHRYQQLTLRF